MPCVFEAGRTRPIAGPWWARMRTEVELVLLRGPQRPQLQAPPQAQLDPVDMSGISRPMVGAATSDSERAVCSPPQLGQAALASA
jgi:hypothetical protein